MAKVIRLTESELKKVINHSVNSILREMDDSNTPEINQAGPIEDTTPASDDLENAIAEAIASERNITVSEGEHDYDVAVGNDGASAVIYFTVDYRPGQPNHPSSSYDEDQTGFDDEYEIVVDEVKYYDEEGEEHVFVPKTDVIRDALDSKVEVEYNGTDDDRAAYWQSMSEID